MTETSSTDRLLRCLREEFGENEMPPADGVAYVSDGTHLECEEVRQKFAGRSWRSLGIDDLLQSKEALNFMTPRAFRYYLPAFIRVTVERFSDSDVIPDTILGILLPTADAQLKMWRRERLGALSAGQVSALRAFVEFLREEHSSEFDEGTLRDAIATIDSAAEKRQ